MTGKYGVGVVERENLFVDGVVEAFGRALLKVGTTAATNEQRVSGEHDLGRVTHERHAAVRVTRCGKRVQTLVTKHNFIAFKTSILFVSLKS